MYPYSQANRTVHFILKSHKLLPVIPYRKDSQSMPDTKSVTDISAHALHFIEIKKYNENGSTHLEKMHLRSNQNYK